MFEIVFKTDDIDRWAERLAVARDDQMPQACAWALNESIANARNELIQEWPGAVHARNSGFIAASLMRTFATKHNLVATIYDAIDRGHLRELAVSGLHVPKLRAMLAVPINITKGSRGVPQSMKPLNLKASFVKDFGRGPAIWQRTSGGKGRKLVYVLKPSVPIPAVWPAYVDFYDVVTREMAVNYGPAMMRAILTAR